ncbi:MAG: hypothetical protein RL839_09380 [Gammaproteobacteria bacterium]
MIDEYFTMCGESAQIQPGDSMIQTLLDIGDKIPTPEIMIARSQQSALGATVR